MDVDPQTAAYCLIPSGRTRTAIFSKAYGERRKVDVRNSAPPHDTLIVAGWTSQDDDGVWFRYDDGELGRIVELPLWVAEHQMLSKP